MSIEYPLTDEDQRAFQALLGKVAQVTIAYSRKGKDLWRRASPVTRKCFSTISAMQRRHKASRLPPTWSADEREAVRAVAQFLVEAWHDLRGTEVPKDIPWMR